jgi:hypothetical protein
LSAISGNQAVGVVVTSNSHVIISTYSGDQMSIYTLTGAPVTTQAIGCTVRSALTIDDSNVLYFICYENPTSVRKFNGAVIPPTFIESITLTGQPALPQTIGFAVAPNGDIWASSGSTFRKYTSTGSYTGVTFNWPGGASSQVAYVDKNNNLWASVPLGPVRQYSSQGVLLQTLTDVGDSNGLVLAGGPLPSQRDPFVGVYVGSSVPNPDQVILFTGSSCAPTQNPTKNPTRNPTKNPTKNPTQNPTI